MPEEEKKKTAKEALKDLSKPLDGSKEAQEEETQRKLHFYGNITGASEKKGWTWYAIKHEMRPVAASDDYDAVYDSASSTYIKLGQPTMADGGSCELKKTEYELTTELKYPGYDPFLDAWKAYSSEEEDEQV